MKTYLLNIPNELKKYSQKLDVQSFLCSKTWEVFNDEGKRQVLIFQSDNTLLISTNGDVIKSTWQFIPNNKTFIITVDGHTTMLRPAFMNNTIMALQKDGTQECLFMIDENIGDVLPTRSLTALDDYLQKCLEEFRKSDPNYLEEQRKLKQKRREEEIENLVRAHQREIDALADKKRARRGIFLIVSLTVFFATTTALIICVTNKTFEKYFTMNMILLLGDIFLMPTIVVNTIFYSNRKEEAKEEIINKYTSQDR